jgi:hypothetical protein
LQHVQAVKRGSVIAYDNPGFDSPAVGKYLGSFVTHLFGQLGNAIPFVKGTQD